MTRPRIYVHRIGTWATRYLDATNHDRLKDFANVVDDSLLEAAPPGIAERLQGGDGILSLNGTGAMDITAEVLSQAPSVKAVSISHWFHDLHDRATKEWRKAGLAVLDVSDGNNFAVAQWTLGATITGVFRFAELDRAMRAGEEWPEHELSSGILDGHRVGIVGLGRIGRLVADLLRPFNVELVGYDKYIDSEAAGEFGVRWVGLDELMSTSTIITFHLPVTDQTIRVITRAHIESIQDGALLINSARTAILDYEAFIEGLIHGRFRAVVDVFEPEPPPMDDPLRSLPNVVMTPHVAGSTSHMCRVCGRTAIEALRDWFAASPGWRND